MSDERHQQLRQLPVQPDQRWQGGIVRLPLWMPTEQRPLRPAMVIWYAVERDELAWSHADAPERVDYETAVSTLLNFACDAQQTLPARLQIPDAALADHIRPLLEGTDVQVEVDGDLPELDRLLKETAEAISGETPPPSLVEAEDVTVDLVRRFADAARTCFQADIWAHIGVDDPIRVESPDGGEDLRWSAAFAQPHTCGFWFQPSVEAHWSLVYQARVDPRQIAGERLCFWQIRYGPVTAIPAADATVWETHGLPVAADHAYPGLWKLTGGQLLRPSRDQLAFFEGFLRAIAETTEADVDAGRWTRRVETADGEQTYTLSLPELLEPPSRDAVERRGLLDPRAHQRTTSADQATSPADQAQALCEDAFEAVGRRRVHLARAALERSDDCPDAYLVLAEQAGDINHARQLLENGVAAGERLLGEERLRGEDLRESPDGRSYLRVKAALVHASRAAGELSRSATLAGELMRQDPADTHQLRYSLLTTLILLGRDREAARIVEQVGRMEGSSFWAYAGALLSYRMQGDSAQSRKALRTAVQANPHVRSHLLGELTDEGEEERDTPGSRPEARRTGAHLAEAWENTLGAVDWLRERGAEREPAGAGGRSRSRSGRTKQRSGSRRKKRKGR